jgi:hypothetical protein
MAIFLEEDRKRSVFKESCNYKKASDDGKRGGGKV